MSFLNDRPKALLINPPVYDFALYDLFLQPYGLMKIGACLDSRGWETRFINCLDYTDPVSSMRLGSPKRKSDGTGKFHRSPAPPPAGLPDIGRRYARYGITRESFLNRLKKAGCGRPPDCICIASGMTYWYPGVVEAAETAGGLFPEAAVVIGGVYATLMPGHAAERTGADAVVRGDTRDFGTVLRKFGLPWEEMTEETPLPEYPGIRAAEIFPDAGVIELNRGCPFSCTYCASRLLCSGFQAGNPETAYHYFSLLYDQGIRNFAFYDDALLFQKEDVLLPFLRAVIAGGHGANFFTPNAVHLRYIDDETAVLMRRAGFRELRLGFESADAAFHTSYDAKFDIGSFSGRVECLKKAGFKAGELRVYVLAGLPGQRAEEVEASVRYAAEAGVRVMLARYSPVPGTALWEESLAQSGYPIEEEPLFHNNTFFSMEWEGFTRQDLRRLQSLTINLNRSLQP